MIDARTAYDRRWWALALLAMTQFIVILDITIVNIALPSIRAALGFSLVNLAWVVNAYMLAFGGFLLLGGRTADLFGRRRIFVIGLTVFGLGTLACGFAQSSGQLIAARVLQGLGGALLSPAALSLVAATFEEGKERNKAFGVWGAVSGAGGAAGVVLGGVLTDGPGWRWVFWVAVPFALGGALIAPALLAESVRERVKRHFDIAGALSVTVGISALVYALVEFEQAGIGSPRTLVPLLVAAALLGTFALVESRTVVPLVPFGFFRLRRPATANITMVLFAAGVVGMNFFLSLYLQQVLGYSALSAGLAFLPMALGQVVVSQVASRLLNRFGLVTILLTGLLLSAAAFAWFGMVSADGKYLTDVLGPAVLLSIGGGFTFVPVMVLAVSGVPMHYGGLAGGLINTSQQIGGAVGLAVLTSLAAWRTAQVNGTGTSAAAALNEGFRLGFFGAAALALLGAVVAILMLRRRPAPADVPMADSGTPEPAVEPTAEPTAEPVVASGATHG